ncbi:uncharacterized protein LOC114647397 isoform X1 [Erpetoichthys calabaricus]|uniref:uncharacterized protein LOC114647397 isoform X1 n=1 Tax=Erpetoichthys calabaricus TaxID=27687 RepID=UPI002234037D|nr:uncharacterized protein LOC114647397 isoform X1 [Erpetoichthys calabaricus]
MVDAAVGRRWIFYSWCWGIFVILTSATESRTSDVTQRHVLVSNNISLPCLVPVSSLGDLGDVSVLWTISDTKGVRLLYNVTAGTGTSHRAGAHVSLERLSLGDASLVIPQVQLGDKGIYTCAVYSAFSNFTAQVELLVSARPTIQVQPSQAEVTLGNEKTFICKVGGFGFYPKHVKITWWKVSGNPAEETAVTTNVCIGSPNLNSGGSYDISSFLLLNPSLEDNATFYKCVVHHPTFTEPLSQQSQLFVKEPEKQFSGFLVIVIVMLAAFLIILLVYLLLFKRVPPRVTELSLKGPLKHKEKSTFQCLVSDFHPKHIAIKLFLQRKDQEKHMILNWNNRRPFNKSAFKEFLQEVCFSNPKNQDECCIPINSVPDVRDLCHSFSAEISKEGQDDGTLMLQVSAFPDISTDQDVKLLLDIEHPALRNPLQKNFTLHIVGEKPRLNEILAPPIVCHGDLVALTCPVSGFKPRPLSITWFKRDRNGEMWRVGGTDEHLGAENGTILVKQSVSCWHSISEGQCSEDFTYNIMSILTFVPSLQEDLESTYICEVYHHATQSTQRRSKVLHVKASPQLDNIQLMQENPQADVPMTLQCRIHSYFPQDTLEVVWYVDGKEVKAGVTVSDTGQADNSLYHCTSLIKLTPTWKDVGKQFKCEVRHDGLAQSTFKEWTLTKLTSLPKVDKIICEPKVPVFGQPVTMSCTIRDFYPKDCSVVWVKGFEIMSDGTETEEPEADKETKLYRCKTRHTFIPTRDDLGCELTVEMIHQGITLRPPKDLSLMLTEGDVHCGR